jgi:hypothetical protein
MCAWGSRIAGIFFPPKMYVAHSAIKFDKEYKTKFMGVGEDFDSREWMVVTQPAKFNGWKDMEPALIPQFEGYREEVARQLLAEHGT